ncbi:hypothetical protein [Crocosphaera watsonii]|uniref:hypothetical protein n=1 Tax=Crocosphaera watsonii TaxID=263511 RepID=UPI0018CE03B8|nr:hypothetical protein [Crocosphaera watsonii]
MVHYTNVNAPNKKGGRSKIKGYNQINLLHGYGILTIISPLEVSIDETNND